MGSAEGSATPVGVVAEIEVLHQALERLQEKERRGRLKVAEAKRVNLALEETNRALSMEAQALAAQAGQAAALERDLQKAYAMQDEILAEHQKMQEAKKIEEAKRNALTSELARTKVENESSWWRSMPRFSLCWRRPGLDAEARDTALQCLQEGMTEAEMEAMEWKA